MGWKALKERFGITHLVQVTDDGISIGSGYIPNLATIDPVTGAVREPEAFARFLQHQYPALLAAAPADLVALLVAADTFTASIPVYFFENGTVVERQCEQPGWPNVTHDGRMMYGNIASTDRNTVIGWGKRDAAAAVTRTREYLATIEADLVVATARLQVCLDNQTRLAAQYPDAEGVA